MAAAGRPKGADSCQRQIILFGNGPAYLGRRDKSVQALNRTGRRTVALTRLERMHWWRTMRTVRPASQLIYCGAKKADG